MKKLIAASALALVAILGLTACSDASEYQERKDKQSEVTLDNSLGIEAQKDRLSREDDPNTIRYIYLLAKVDGSVLGYYTITGGVYGADTQLAPEQEIICKWSSAESCQAVDSAKDNGTYGGNDQGVFFITTEGVLVETTLDYLQSDAPIAFYGSAPKLNQ